jgi:hypothetical protein
VNLFDFEEKGKEKEKLYLSKKNSKTPREN